MRVTVGAVVKGKTSLNYETGNWRQDRPVIIFGKCKYCGICADVCPDTAIHAFKRSGRQKPEYVIDYAFCKGCGLCVYECPFEAMEMEAEDK